MRVLAATAGIALGVAAVPLAVVLPELGIPVLLLALRLLAVEFEWAAGGYAWVVWRWAQLKGWYRSRPAAVRGVIILVLLVLAAGLVWLLAHAAGL